MFGGTVQRQHGDAARARTILVDGASKTFAMTGWRVGFAVGQAELRHGIVEYAGEDYFADLLRDYLATYLEKDVQSLATLGNVALFRAASAVVLNEVHYNPAGGSSHEFVELFNAGGTPFQSLARLLLVGQKLSGGTSWST